MKNCVGVLKLLRFSPSTRSSSMDLMCGDIASEEEGIEMEMCFRELELIKLNLELIVSVASCGFTNDTINIMACP